MLKIFNKNKKHSKCVKTSLVLQTLLILTTASSSIPQGVGGSDDGDPAPGRSPGPPKQSFEVSEENVEFRSDEKKIDFNVSIWCKNYISPPPSPLLNVSINHFLFGTFKKLIPEIVYDVMVNQLSNKKKKKIEEIYVSTTINEAPIGTWKNESIKKLCSDENWVPVTLEKTLNWIFYISVPSNITFRFRYRLTSGKIYEENFFYPADTECVLTLKKSRGSFGSADLPSLDFCRILFPREILESSSEHKEGLLIELTRLNVPCSKGGFIQFVEDTNDLQDKVFTSPKKLCGKLEELNSIERKLYFPSLSETDRPFLLIHKNPVFSLKYHLVDYCYNVTFVSRNGSLVLKPVKNLLCHFRIHLPFGNRVLLRLQMGEDKLMSTTQNYEEKAQKIENSGKFKLGSSNFTIQNTLKRSANIQVPYLSNNVLWEQKVESKDCDGLSVEVWDGSLTWNHCSRHGDPKRDVQVWSQENVITIKVAVEMTDLETSVYSNLKFWYHAEPIREIVGTCDFGEVLIKQFCISFINIPMDWKEADQFCGKRGGHLASIRDEASQKIVDDLLLSSPDYKEHNSYWIGASDKIYEGHFRWSDGFIFSYSNWFPGWPQQGFYNRQPNDDGFSNQDCVEIRRVFPHMSGSRIIDGTTPSYLWNDLDCDSKNFFLCERLESGESSEQSLNQECNKTIILAREHPKTTVVSPVFPHQYPDNIYCETTVVAPVGFRLIIDFEELVMEKEPSCSYDYLELIEESWNESYVARRLCGDMSDRLKLLRYISQGPRVKFLFISDYSHHYGGFKAKVSIDNAGMECSDERYQRFNNSCYLFVSYPKVTWETAGHICQGMKAELASVLNLEEENFITGNIRKSREYTTSSAYWLGGHKDVLEEWKWIDGSSMEYNAWSLGEENEKVGEKNRCLAIQWVSTKTEKGHPASGLYWTSQPCKKIGGYVCKKKSQVSGITLNLNKTLNGTEGHITSPGYPSPYYNNLDYYVHFKGPILTRLVIVFLKLELEHQADCLYDYIELKSGGVEESQVRLCGNKASKKNNRSIFVSDNNEAVMKFHSDYSVTGMGFFANWNAVDITGCPSQKLTAKEGIISSPNYGNFLLPRLDCTTVILAPPGKRIWIEFSEISLKDSMNERGATLEIDLGGNLRPVQTEEGLGKKNFVSFGEKMIVRLITSNDPGGNGFRALYRTVSLVEEEKIVKLLPNTNGLLHHINYPAPPPPHVDFVQHFIAPIGYVIYLEFHQVALTEKREICPDGNGIIEITDNYADENGTWWFLCEAINDPYYPDSALAITSYLNTLHIRQKSLSVGARMNASLKVKEDKNFKLKLLRASEEGNIESCHPNPCQNGGKCLTFDSKKTCRCVGHYTGMFCALTLCELEPCVFGQCELTPNGYRCLCQTGYTGLSCEKKQSPCEDNPCEGRGECVEKNDQFHCRCHAWWEGPRCEKRMMHIPFKPLSERMLQEPFWLGLITVFVVLAIIGLVWCAKRHFPEKLEKLLAEEADRNNRSNVSGIIRPPSVREQVHATGGALTVASSPSTASCPRTLFGRLGIRKSSVLSLTSPLSSDAGTCRTFSLDDILRPPRRTPSPRKKSGNSNPSKRNAAEKKQILQQLICPTTGQNSTPKVCLNDFSILKESEKIIEQSEKLDWKETSFSVSPIKSDLKADLNKLEKKVTFAKLLNKVSAEMNSNPNAHTFNPAFLKAVSTPVSPALERKTSHSVNSNLESDSLSSSEIAISGSAFNSLLDIPGSSKKPSRMTYKGAKNASADSILEMFRCFTPSSVLSKGKGTISSTTPSPQDDRIFSYESSIVDTPISTTSDAGDSPTDKITYATTIEIPVMDALTAQKTASSCLESNLLQPPSVLLEVPSGGANKFLSPIREVPTPTPTPALTPTMPRIAVKIPQIESSDEEFDQKSYNDDDGSEELSELMIQIHREKNDDDSLSPVDEDFRQNFSLSMDQNSVPDPPDIIIPLLTVQEPTPPSTSPTSSIPGSPPPQKEMQQFVYSSSSMTKRFSKGADKPNSLDLPYSPPLITITCNVSEPESDIETMSATSKNQNLGSHNTTGNSTGMTYLSPFSMCSREDRTASESNLSSSGYSSMASPGPSRCGSNNPLCLSEIEDHQQSQNQSPSPRPPSLLRTPDNENDQSEKNKHRKRSDSETLSDDPLMESNDEGIGTDHLDEKIEEGEVKSARDLQIFLGKELSNQNLLDFSSFLVPVSPPQRAAYKKCDNLDCSNTLGSPLTKASLQLPTIVVQSDFCDKLLSPVSSRSESPLSDKALGLGRFSPMFYSKNKCDHLPFTDSDGLYDFPSSDCPPSNKNFQAVTTSHRKSTGRRRERRNNYRMTTSGSKTSSPTKNHNSLLEVPPKDAPGHRIIAQRKLSPKRKIRTQQPLSSSSSTESLTSGKSLLEGQGKVATGMLPGSNEASAEDTAEEASKVMLESNKNEPRPQKRISGFRTIGHQIRFLRRIELSLKRKENLVSCFDSEDDDDVDDPSLSLLPQDAKINPIVILPPSAATSKRRGHKKRSMVVLPSRFSAKHDLLTTAPGQTN